MIQLEKNKHLRLNQRQLKEDFKDFAKKYNIDPVRLLDYMHNHVRKMLTSEREERRQELYKIITESVNELKALGVSL